MRQPELLQTIKKVSGDIIRVAQEIAQKGLVVAAWGNVSARLSAGDTGDSHGHGAKLAPSLGTDLYAERVLLTPSGMDYHKLQEADLALTDLAGRIIQGQRRPTTELSLHLAIYRQRPDIRAIVHTHSLYASVLAVAGLSLPPVLDELAQKLGGTVPLNQYAPSGTEELAENTVKALGSGKAVLLANHGLIGTGETLEEAFLICQLVEKGAQVYILSRGLGEPNCLNPAQVLELRKRHLNHYGQK